jgi:hypothetical protein
MDRAGDAGKLKLESGVKMWRRIARNGLRWYEMARDGWGVDETPPEKEDPISIVPGQMMPIQLPCFTSTTTMMITNIYAITAIAVIGGSLFGFDLSSMSAM